ncbi:MAG: hypothetical protein AB7T49_18485 [Oligoflexales bacterium]
MSRKVIISGLLVACSLTFSCTKEKNNTVIKPAEPNNSFVPNNPNEIPDNYIAELPQIGVYVAKFHPCITLILNKHLIPNTDFVMPVEGLNGNGHNLTPTFPHRVHYDPQLNLFTSTGFFNRNFDDYSNVEMRLDSFREGIHLDVSFVFKQRKGEKIVDLKPCGPVPIEVFPTGRIVTDEESAQLLIDQENDSDEDFNKDKYKDKDHKYDKDKDKDYDEDYCYEDEDGDHGDNHDYYTDDTYKDGDDDFMNDKYKDDDDFHGDKYKDEDDDDFNNDKYKDKDKYKDEDDFNKDKYKDKYKDEDDDDFNNDKYKDKYKDEDDFNKDKYKDKYKDEDDFNKKYNKKKKYKHKKCDPIYSDPFAGEEKILVIPFCLQSQLEKCKEPANPPK